FLLYVMFFSSFFFFFSSRRRHTRCLSDWSSDVCSSDLQDEPRQEARVRHRRRRTSPPEAPRQHPDLHPSYRRTGGRSLQIQFGQDRKSTRLNSSHLGISYAVFCLKKKSLIELSGERVRA